MTDVNKLLNTTSAGWIAKKLDAADGNQNGQINASIWNEFVGKIGTGILKLITFGGCGIWSLLDIIMIITGRFTDKDGNEIKSN